MLELTLEVIADMFSDRHSKSAGNSDCIRNVAQGFCASRAEPARRLRRRMSRLQTNTAATRLQPCRRRRCRAPEDAIVGMSAVGDNFGDPVAVRKVSAPHPLDHGLTESASDFTIDLLDPIRDGALTGGVVSRPGADEPAFDISENPSRKLDQRRAEAS